MDKAKEYMETVQGLVQRALDTQLEAVCAAARCMAEALKNDGRIYVFGTGHSHVFAEELFYRAGGLASIHPILEEPLMLHSGAAFSTEMERLEPYGALIVEEYGLTSGDVLVAASNSGRNGAIVEVACQARARGVTVIALINLTQARQGVSRHSSGKNLHQIADVVLDNLGIEGDAALEVGNYRVGPTSTVMGALLLNATVVQTVQLLMDAGVNAEVFTSSNMCGGDEKNKALIQKYKGVIRSL